MRSRHFYGNKAGKFVVDRVKDYIIGEGSMAIFKRKRSKINKKPYSKKKPGVVKREVRKFVKKKLYKKKKSITATRTDDLHSGKDLSRSVVYLGKKHGKKGKNVGQLMYRQSNGILATCTPGTQGYANLGFDLALHQLILNVGDSNEYDGNASPNKYSLPLFQMNPNLFPTGGPTLATDGITLYSANTANLTAMLYVDKITYEVQVTNMTSVPTDVRLYLVTPSRPSSNYLAAATSLGAISDWSNMNAQGAQASSQFSSAADASGVQSNAVLGYSSIFYPGWSPHKNKNCGKMTKFLWHKEVTLAGGATHKYYITVCVKKMFDLSALRGMDAGSFNSIAGSPKDVLNALPYKTLQLVALFKGSPVVVKDAGGIPSGVNQKVTLSSCELAFTVNKTIKGNYANGNQNIRVDNALDTMRNVSGTSTIQHISTVDTAIGETVVI